MMILQYLGKQAPTPSSRYVREFVLAQCPRCGSSFRTQLSAIKSGNTKSCGCAKDGAHFITTKLLRMQQPRLYRIWKNMRSRCNNTNIPLAKNYSLRGISHAPEWCDFAIFYEWALNSGYSDELSIDRIDVDGNYEPNNCRWATRKQQMENTRRLRVTNTSGYRGVSKKGDKFSARATDAGKRVFLGVYPTAEDAARAYDNYVMNHRLNYPINCGAQT